MKAKLFFTFLIFICTLAIRAQAGLQQRDWLVGHYAGIWKDSTTHSLFSDTTLDVYYSNGTSTPNNDSGVVLSIFPGMASWYVAMDSTIGNFNGLAPGGKLFNTDVFIFHYPQPGCGFCPESQIYFTGKKKQTYSNINELEIEQKLKVYPNPASNIIRIIGENVELNEIKLFDLLGKEVLNSKEKDIDISNAQEGVYFIQVKTVEGILTKKIIVQH